ncbi:hypothetical protein BDW69DRAFT_179348 [Aspergillus filifer]
MFPRLSVYMAEATRIRIASHTFVAIFALYRIFGYREFRQVPCFSPEIHGHLSCRLYPYGVAPVSIQALESVFRETRLRR